MGRKRNRDTSSATARSQNPDAPPHASVRTGKNRRPYSNPVSAAHVDRAGRNPWLLAAVCAILLLSTILAFRPALDKNFGFVNLDDNHYVYENEHVRQGLTGDSMRWAFTSLEYDNWHPLTWLSHMLDRQIFGPESLEKPWGYHLTNILIHAINVLVLFLALRQMTDATWPSLLVAVLFGMHPLRAESVAWISERKDVLSGLFFLLVLWAYAAYAQHGRSWARYGLVIVLFVFGLMAKPMLVTLPVLLLLLDYWPLGRWRGAGSEEQGAGSGEQGAGSGRLLLEKLPLLLISGASCVVTMIAQQGAMKVIDTTTFSMRLENALVSYATYIGEIFYPANLSPLYPFPENGVPWPNIMISVVVLVAITALAVRLRSWPWLAVGWLWYLVATLPVIGLVQVGVQAMADRYTYLPHIGLYMMLAWSLEALSVSLPFRRWVWTAALLLLIPLLVQATAAQTAIWKNSETLWIGALKANPEIALAENNLGYIVERKGKTEEAFRRYQHAVQIRPRYVEAHINLGNMYIHMGKSDEAEKHYSTAIEIRPDYDLGYINLGKSLMLRGELLKAEANFRKALEIDPRNIEVYWKLGQALVGQKKFDEGIAALRKAVDISPGSFAVWETLGQTLLGLGRNDEATACFETLLQQPATAGEATETLGYLCYVKRQPQKALAYWSSFLNNNPDSLPVLTMSAWLLATDPSAEVRNGSKALTLALRAKRISEGRDARVLVALAAAYAETGDFGLATQTIEQAKQLTEKHFPDSEMLKLQRQYQSGARFYDANASLVFPAGASR